MGLDQRQYTTSTTATVTVVVRDASGATIRTLKAPGSQPAGTYSLAWDGKNASGSLVPVGTYSVRVTATTSGSVSSTGSRERLGARVSDQRGQRDTSRHRHRFRLEHLAVHAGQQGDRLRRGADLGQDDGATLRSATTQQAGTYTLTWDGKGTHRDAPRR